VQRRSGLGRGGDILGEDVAMFEDMRWQDDIFVLIPITRFAMS
jgi:hypothetical protein